MRGLRCGSGHTLQDRSDDRIEQGESHVVLRTGQALLLNCRTPQSYCTAPGQSCWHHYWVHLDGAGVAAMEPLLLPGKAPCNTAKAR